MNDWKEYKLSDFAGLVKEGYIPNGINILNYIGLEHIEQEKLHLNRIGKSLDITSNKFKFSTNDILFGKLRPYFRKVVKPKFDGICSTDIWVFRAKNGFDQNFLFYFLANWEFVNLANNTESGTRMPRADWNFLKDTVWRIPPITEQRVIASILGNLDDKIDLLHNQNKMLEKMAETLFRQWFVEETSANWQITQLSAHTEVIRGLSYKGIGLTDSSDGIPMHNLNSIYEGGGYKYEGIKYYKGDFKDRHIVKPGDIIVANTEQGHKFLLIGYPAVIPSYFGNMGIFSQHIYKVLLLKPTYLTSQFIYYLVKSLKVREQITGATNGSTVNMLAIDGLQLPEFQLPPKEMVFKFSEIVKNLWNKKDENHYQIQTLQKLRDTLIPKLMSGEVRVNL